jgi:hypothetical protein
MIPSQCMILSAREGVNIEAIETHRVLRKTEYRVKSAHGVSPNFFKCMTNLLILGLLQGSAAVSIMWTMLSTLALTVLSSDPYQPVFIPPGLKPTPSDKEKPLSMTPHSGQQATRQPALLQSSPEQPSKPKPGPESSSCAVDGST